MRKKLKKEGVFIMKLTYKSILIIIGMIMILSLIQFVTKYLYGVDGYYHIRMSKFILGKGISNRLSWAIFTTFQNAFSDKDFLFHIYLIPFVLLIKDLMVAGKVAVIVLNILFLLTLYFVLKNYLKGSLLLLSLILPYISTFIIYGQYLRSQNLAYIFLIILVHLVIKKSWKWLILVSALYTLTHVSFPLLIVMVIIQEILRYIHSGEFCTRTILAVIGGILIALLLHPYSIGCALLVTYLNFLLVPLLSFTRSDISFGLELTHINTGDFFLQNILTLLLIFLAIFVFMLKSKEKNEVTFASFAYFVPFTIYFILSLLMTKFSPLSGIMGSIFFLVLFNDMKLMRFSFFKYTFLMFCLIIAVIFSITSLKNSIIFTKKSTVEDEHFLKVSQVINKYVKKGTFIFHDSYFDSQYLLFYCPNYKYIGILDPIFMYYRTPRFYKYYQKTRHGQIKNPYIVLKEIFNTRYAHLRMALPLFNMIKEDKRFKILYKDKIGAFVEILDEKKECHEHHHFD